ncbi:MAG: hypothetical protein A2958_01050 [Candidatus Levybacteria bacterium RIFCSPLOWO2_01_FULL_38_13]|nr:MAG: hypothetical protein A2629_00945 [Candidatus Levybacteria bacterium RIFCSPHIGHO2_01_FULL_41_15]OGH34875.1 MAG: hypothetical protein A2958_01050 [Candidatus Levybacteria bacterium RIFCSPLOWO2_01_FULL_38_13]
MLTLDVVNFWQHLKYKNLSLLGVSLIIAVILFRLESFHQFLLGLGDLGYIGAFIAGILFVSTFTVATGGVILLVLSEKLSPVEIGIFAGLGAVLGDFTIFRFVRDNLAGELKAIYNHIDHNNHLVRILHTKYFSWTFPVFGAIIIASPLPDEIGVSLMGISRMKTYKFLILSFILNASGIFLVISASSWLRP